MTTIPVTPYASPVARPTQPGEGSENKKRDPRLNPDTRHANAGWRLEWTLAMDPRKGR